MRTCRNEEDVPIPGPFVAVYIAFHSQDWNTLANGDPDPERPQGFAGPP
jgi:hypothetical protein